MTSRRPQKTSDEDDDEFFSAKETLPPPQPSKKKGGGGGTAAAPVPAPRRRPAAPAAPTATPAVPTAAQRSTAAPQPVRPCAEDERSNSSSDSWSDEDGAGGEEEEARWWKAEGVRAGERLSYRTEPSAVPLTPSGSTVRFESTQDVVQYDPYGAMRAHPKIGERLTGNAYRRWGAHSSLITLKVGGYAPKGPLKEKKQYLVIKPTDPLPARPSRSHELTISSNDTLPDSQTLNGSMKKFIGKAPGAEEAVEMAKIIGRIADSGGYVPPALPPGYAERKAAQKSDAEKKKKSHGGTKRPEKKKGDREAASTRTTASRSASSSSSASRSEAASKKKDKSNPKKESSKK